MLPGDFNRAVRAAAVHHQNFQFPGFWEPGNRFCNDTGFIQGDGPYYPQVRTPIRPRPLAGFRDRLYCVGMSPESVEQAAALGARLMTFSQQPWELYAEGTLADYRRAWAKHHPGEPPPPLTGDLMFCHADAGRAEELAREYMSNYFLSIIEHYEILSDHFAKTKGYAHYANASEAFRAAGVETIAAGLDSRGYPSDQIERIMGGNWYRLFSEVWK